MAIGSWCAGVVAYFIALNLNFIMSSIGAIYATVIVTAIIYWVASNIVNKRKAA